MVHSVLMYCIPRPSSMESLEDPTVSLTLFVLQLFKPLNFEALYHWKEFLCACKRKHSGLCEGSQSTTCMMLLPAVSRPWWGNGDNIFPTMERNRSWVAFFFTSSFLHDIYDSTLKNAVYIINKISLLPSQLNSSSIQKRLDTKSAQKWTNSLLYHNFMKLDRVNNPANSLPLKSQYGSFFQSLELNICLSLKNRTSTNIIALK